MIHLFAILIALGGRLGANALAFDSPTPTSSGSPCPRLTSNAFIDDWACPQRRKMLVGAYVSGRGWRVLTRRDGFPNEVIEPKQHLRGQVVYDARVTELHGHSGHLVIPIESSGRRYLLVFWFAGEFSGYLGPESNP
jgi:hypothetical protein